MLRRFYGMKRRNTTNVVHTATASGTAHIMFDEGSMKLLGTLVGKNTGCISFRGYVDSDSKQKQTAISISVDVIDVESDQNFRINDVRMELDVDPKTSRRNMTLEHPSLKFITQRWHYGCRADVEIHKHINPQMAGCGWELFIGQMTIIMINTYQFAPLTRRLSLTNGDVIESSNDFLA